ncbi:MAG: cytochrome-c peroxidase [Halobacteriovoraceae bacterium]|nr:cytochrome-c peroxidase [Halobacteriovoraceae bacterium]MCB9095452.1 cytochrome-c peroxidase [Halobacteriovoraceae bacterium]
MAAAGTQKDFELDMEEVKSTFKPLPKSLIDKKKNSALIKLGKKLYLEKRLSVNNKISCNSCHKLDNYGVDNEPTSPGHDGTRGERNSPTTFNAALHFVQFWDGRAKDLKEQALGPILNPVEMGMPGDKEVVKKLSSDKQYVAEFKKAFPKDKEPFNYNNVGVAIEAFETTLLTPSRFDDFLNGKKNALTKKEKRGLKRFMDTGCTSCHYGVAIGGNDYQMIGQVNEYQTKDLGRFMITKKEEDKKVFKVPSLRNIAKTHPYFHDGSVKTLDEAIRLMAFHQLGEKVDKEFIEDVKAFLNSLTAKKVNFL